MTAPEQTPPDMIIGCPPPRSSPEAAVAGSWPVHATYLRCDGCGVSAVFEQDEQSYGGLVHSFLDEHEQCGNAVQITRAEASRAEASRN
jgi:hypothetical protein